MKKILIWLFFSATLSASAQDNPVYVIGNSNGVPGQLSFAQLKSIFMGNQPKWSNGSKVLIAMPKLNSPAGKPICDRLFHMSSDQVTKHWLAVSMKGTATAPVFVNSPAEIRQFVSSNPGAIAVTTDPSVSGPVKLITVDGKRSF